MESAIGMPGFDISAEDLPKTNSESHKDNESALKDLAVEVLDRGSMYVIAAAIDVRVVGMTIDANDHHLSVKYDYGDQQYQLGYTAADEFTVDFSEPVQPIRYAGKINDSMREGSESYLDEEQEFSFRITDAMRGDGQTLRITVPKKEAEVRAEISQVKDDSPAVSTAAK